MLRNHKRREEPARRQERNSCDWSARETGAYINFPVTENRPIFNCELNFSKVLENDADVLAMLQQLHDLMERNQDKSSWPKLFNDIERVRHLSIRTILLYDCVISCSCFRTVHLQHASQLRGTASRAGSS